MEQFKLRGVTQALIAAGLASLPGLVSASITGTPALTSQAPKTAAGVMFVGAKAGPVARGIRVVTNTSANTNAPSVAPTLDAYAYSGTGVASTTSVCIVSVPGVLVTASTTSIFSASAVFPTTCSYDRVALVYSSGGTDTFDGTAAFAQVGTAATLTVVAAATGSSLAMATNAVNTSNTIAANANYTGPIISSAAQTGVGTIALSFNAQLAGDATGTSAASANTVTGANVVASKVIDGSTVASSFSAAANAVTALTAGAANSGSGAYTSLVNKVRVLGGQIFDTAGNQQANAQTVYTSFSGTNGVALTTNPSTAAKTAIVVATGATLTSSAALVNAWNGSASGSGSAATIQVALRTNEALANSGTAANAVTVVPAGLTTALSVTSSGTAGTDLLVTLTPTGFFGFDSTGRLIHSGSASMAAATVVQVGLSSNATHTWSVLSSGTTISTSGVAAVDIFAGPAAKPTLGVLTLDNDTDGFLDGVTVRSHDQFPTFTVSAPNFAAGTAGLSIASMASTSSFGSVTTAPDTLNLNVVMSSTTNDWDGDGTTNGDTALYVLPRFGTGLTNSGTAAGTFPYKVAIAGVAATTGASTLNYANIFRATDGGALPVNNTEASNTSTTSYVDNAKPVVVKIEYNKTSTAADATNGFAEFGTMTVSFSEPIDFQNGTNVVAPVDAISNLLLGGQPVTLFNLDFNVPQKAQAFLTTGKDPKTSLAFNTGGTSTGIGIAYMPNSTGNTIIGKVLTFSNTGPDIGETGTALPDLLASVNLGAGSVTANQVGTVSTSALKIVKAELQAGFDGSAKINFITLTYDGAVALAPSAVQSDVDGLYVVRAQVGAVRDTRSATDPAPSGSRNSFYDFYIPSAKILVPGNAGTASVTLIIPDSASTGNVGLPGDSLKIWVDYQGSASTSSKFNLRLASNSAVVADGDQGGAGSLFSGVTVDAPAGSASNILIDDDTKSVAFSPLQLADNKASAATRNLLTHTIIGTAKRSTAGANLPDLTSIRADLIIIEDGIGLSGTPGRDAVLAGGDGSININQGQNPAAGGTVQTVALRNQGAVSAKDFADYNKALRDLNAAIKSKVTTPGVTNTSKIAELLKPERDVLINRFFVEEGNALVTGTTASTGTTIDNNTSTSGGGKLYAYVEVTTGAGKDAASGTNTDNANAAYGRTATLMKNLPNVQRNGTTYFPVFVDLVTGNVKPYSKTVSGNPITEGQLVGQFFSGADILGSSSTTRPRGFRVRDTAFALVKNGVYNVIVGAPEADFATAGAAALTPHASIASTAANAFVQLSVFDSVSGEYKLATQGDPSFGGAGTSATGATTVNHIRFTHDLSRNVPTRLNIDMSLIGEGSILTQNGWQLVGLPGDMNRTPGALSGRFFLTTDPVTGQPTSNFEFDNKSKDEAFTLGVDQGAGTVAGAPNKLTVAFDSSNGVSVVNLNPRFANGLAFNYNSGTGFNVGVDSVGFGPSTMQNELSVAGADGRLNDVIADYKGNGTNAGDAQRTKLKVFYPIRPTASNPSTKLVKNSWHLVTIQGNVTTLGGMPNGIDGAIIVNGLAGTGGGAKAWFRTPGTTTVEPATASLDSLVLKKGDAIFVHVGASDLTLTPALVP